MSRYGPRIAALSRRAERERAALDSADDSAEGTTFCTDPDLDHDPDPDDADEYLRDGAGQAIWLYIEARTGGRLVPFSEPELDALEDAMNRWFECYAHCHGVELEADFTVREAAEVLLETRNIVDTTQLLTRIPERESGSRPLQ
ncbi:hypothetical protein [Natrinema halophilum]|uniref:DUF8055 domain-containing protein n=1 Tax=Natrinema halophilum TaxID=1699371 RepID=A0A7D5GK96_9EURY|nr:hypothetical protein [Natrinema halophilum]QLG48472.1 hypothetical protein HYG82_06230 [Natrinema halophilum]